MTNYNSPLVPQAERVLSITKTLAILVFLQALVLFPFRFTSGMQERDSYRMLLGMLDGITRGTYFASPLLYNREVSFGYYWLIYSLGSLFGHTPGALIAIMNAISLVAAVLFVIPFFLVVRELFDRYTAIASCILLAVIPVWWNVALYGHPIMPAMLLFFSASAILACQKSEVTPPYIHLLVIFLLSLALTFRFDITLLFPALAAVIWHRVPRFRAAAVRTASYAISAILLFKLAQLALPAVKSGSQSESILALLQRFENLGQVSGNLREAIREAIIIMGQGFTPFLLILVIPAFVILIRWRDPAQILFTSVVILLNVGFWFPNPFPARHYLQMAPALSTAGAISGLWLVSKISAPHLRLILAQTCGVILGLLGIAVSIGLHCGHGLVGEFRSPFLTRFALDNERRHNSQIARDLLALQGSNQPVIVLCDFNFVAAQMETLAEGVTVQPHWYRAANGTPIQLEQVEYHGHTYLMIEQSWDEAKVAIALDQMDLYPTYPVLVDPYNLAIKYPGPRPRAHLERTTTGERIELAEASAVPSPSSSNSF